MVACWRSPTFDVRGQRGGGRSGRVGGSKAFGSRTVLRLLFKFDYPSFMFIALYEFKVKPGFEKQFEENWAIVTEYIYSIRGSLGSRLHKAQDNTYVAYAQWPDEAQYDLDTPLPPVALNARTLMKDACENQTVLKLMSVVADLLKD